MGVHVAAWLITAAPAVVVLCSLEDSGVFRLIRLPCLGDCVHGEDVCRRRRPGVMTALETADDLPLLPLRLIVYDAATRSLGRPGSCGSAQGVPDYASSRVVPL